MNLCVVFSCTVIHLPNLPFKHARRKKLDVGSAVTRYSARKEKSVLFSITEEKSHNMLN